MSDIDPKWIEKFFDCVSTQIRGKQKQVQQRGQLVGAFYCNWFNLTFSSLPVNDSQDQFEILFALFAAKVSVVRSKLESNMTLSDDGARVFRKMRNTLKKLYRLLSMTELGQITKEEMVRQSLVAIYDWKSELSLAAYLAAMGEGALKEGTVSAIKSRARDTIIKCCQTHLGQDANCELLSGGEE